MHTHDEKNGKGMMWMMVICCAMPLLLILVLGTGGRAFGVPTGVVLGGVAVMVVAHFFMMGKSHKHSEHSDEDPMTAGSEDKNKDGKDKEDHSSHECCR